MATSHDNPCRQWCQCCCFRLDDNGAVRLPAQLAQVSLAVLISSRTPAALEWIRLELPIGSGQQAGNQRKPSVGLVWV